MIYKNRILILFTFFLICINYTRGQPPQLQVGENQRSLVTDKGDPVFLIGDTGWRLPLELDRQEIEKYLSTRNSQGFNCIGIAAIMGEDLENSYGDVPFQTENGKWDPSKPIITKGNNPNNSDEYDYWDHLEYIIDIAGQYDIYVALVISFNGWVAGSWDGSDESLILFNKKSAYEYGYWIGNRFGEKPHILWMIGGDRTPVFNGKDYREVYNAMAKGLQFGVYKTRSKKSSARKEVLISYHPQKKQPTSSTWFHNESWLAFNSLQACPSDIVEVIRNDYFLKPTKPTWLFEGRYENYTNEWSDWTMRFQAYLSVFAGGFGHLYGHEDIWDFSSGWKESLYDEGAMDMKHFHILMTTHIAPYYISDFLPDTSLLTYMDLGEVSKDCWKHKTTKAAISTRTIALRSRDSKCVLVYSSNGRTITLDKSNLSSEINRGYWYNPRTGGWALDDKNFTEMKSFTVNLSNRSNSNSIEFDPPGIPESGNDWVLILKAK